ncbi:hypothetical protein NADFUDRAFT_81309 [Nadsonia fulvescens var. elongata DSM 6958]|uniref:Uncharacterized protein n=1 Tax=Nadsonia fulvescens var. elongata DSM 6958 TaxID=857566 RepID=A0A1E3PS93_9ASCO|nr:hypothetical protein NADFUDRAFT_81309 [Nadsonia fulvescens var. elongata DSM 6958]
MPYLPSDSSWLPGPRLAPPNHPYSSPLRPSSSLSPIGASISSSPRGSSPATAVHHQPHRPLLHLRSPTKAREHRQAQYRQHIRQQRNHRILDSRGGLDRMADDVMFAEFREWIHRMETQAKSIDISDEQLDQMLQEEEQAEAEAQLQTDMENPDHHDFSGRKYTPSKKPLSRQLFGDPIKKRPRAHARSLSSPSNPTPWLSTSPSTTMSNHTGLIENPFVTSTNTRPNSLASDTIGTESNDEGYQEFLLDMEEQELQEQQEIDFLVDQFSRLDHNKDLLPMDTVPPEYEPFHSGQSSAVYNHS